MANKPTDIDDVLDVVTELSTMVSQQFEAVSRRFDQQDARLFRIENDIAELKTDSAEMKGKINHIYSVLDSHTKLIEDILVDNRVRDHQRARMERWIFLIADKVSVKLK